MPAGLCHPHTRARLRPSRLKVQSYGKPCADPGTHAESLTEARWGHCGAALPGTDRSGTEAVMLRKVMRFLKGQVVLKAGHNIQLNDPQLVLDAIASLVT